MSPAHNKYPQPPKSASSQKAQTDAQANSSPEPPSSAEPVMDQHPDTTLVPIPPKPPNPPTAVSSTESDSPSTPPPPAPAEPGAQPSQPHTVTESASSASTASASSPVDASEQPAISRQQPIPPASEPMQYRAIGLVRGKYVASEEQFTRGNLHTDDGAVIDTVLLGRVMSLVKKHLDLEQSHLWVVYPRTREKGNDLHVQIVGVWEPEKLNRMDALSDDESDGSDEDEDTLSDDEETLDETSDVVNEAVDATVDEATEPVDATSEVVDEATEPVDEATDEPLDVSSEVATELKPEPVRPEPAATEAASSDESISSVAVSDLDDRYFSVRGEVVYQSIEEQRLLVKIRRSPRQGSDQAKIFKVALRGVLEGKAVGYFWDLHVQRQDNDLVVQEGTMIGLVPPQKRSKSQRGGPPRRGPGRGGPPRKNWQGSREGGPPRPPSRSGGDRPGSPAPQRESSNIAKPIKRRNRPEQSDS